MKGIASEVLTFLKSKSRTKAGKIGFTDSEIATALVRPVASVRRARYALESSPLGNVSMYVGGRPLRSRIEKRVVVAPMVSDFDTSSPF